MARLRFVVDAGPLISAIDADDAAHSLGAALVHQAGVDLLVSDMVLAEVDYMVRSRLSGHAARTFLQGVLAGDVRRIPFDRELFERAVDYDRTYADLSLGLTDASVMALAERERAVVLTWDFGDFRATRPLRGGFWRLAIDEDRFRKALCG